MKHLLLSVAILLLCFSCDSEKIEADTIFVNGVIWTANPNMKEVEAMAVKSDTIIAVGSTIDLQKYIGKSTHIVDLQNKFVTPGFIDAHVHLLMGGNSLLSVQLRDAKTKEEFAKRIKDFASGIKPNQWIVEGNWDHTLWGGELPTKEWIDVFTQQNPVAVYRMDGHMILANSAALKIAGIDRNTPDVENGEIVKNSNGEPTGILKSKAMYLVLNKIPALSDSQKEKAIKVAQEYLHAQGVTSIQDVDSLGGFEVLKKMHSNNELKIRVYSADPLHSWKSLSKKEKVNNKWLKNGLLKGFVDGSLGSHSAAFLEPYSDKPTDSGILTANIDSLQTWIEKADTNNLHVTVHAIGDKANHTLLNTYEAVEQTNGSKDRRFRIEHAQHLNSDDISRFSELNIIASMQPYHAIDDGRWAEELIGPERIKTTYAFNSLLDAGTTLVFGSDWPVAPASPILGIHAAITRQTLDNKNPEGWVPEQKINAEQALLAYTKNAAYSAFNETIKGTLEVGKLADFVVLSNDIRSIDPINIRNVQVLYTYIGGKKVYEKK
ncbi:amidohydrolase [Spongiivirga citrea]|uniref:Amidohydrolase family protein n=1 Tax=Spongiivirga citrea TaxID=1481457 RepID=A0A6M0CQB6_9FLAO|nr:amidohydrolase [Spongiivirga citrea]NER19113.1 amidohydrolase family protein [Spongiivirga citrea]